MDSILPYIVDLKKQITLLVSRYSELKEKNINLRNEKINLTDRIGGLERKVKELKKRVEIVNVAKGIDVVNTEYVGFARSRVNNLIREIDKCMSLLNE